MSLYDDIEPTVKRQRTPDRRVSESSNSVFEIPTHPTKDKGFAAVNMFAPRTLMTKTTKPPPRTHAPSTLQAIYSDPKKPTPPPSSSSTFPTAAPLVQQQQNPTQSGFDFEALKNQVKQKKMEVEKMINVSNKTLPTLKAHRVDVSKIQALPIIPPDVREDTEFLFDEVHILDEYQPSKPNSYFEFMKSIGCNPQFGEEIDDFKLEKLIQDEIINGQLEKDRSPSPEPEKELVSGTDVAANIMAKMGYTFGSGLGKHGQGMSSALKVEKKGGQAGKIIHETDEVMREVGLNPETFQGPITNILLLRNIYTLDDIPDDYDNELRPELSRYGVIKNLILHRDSEAEDFFDQCRIFVDYPNKAAAIRAYADLNNRYFNGKNIRATFYPTDRFMLGHYFDPSY
uniref:RNA-binding motif protein 17 n=1 Tax=Panagrolaimus sp. PS1159 TaxID=55785 RepID=A0AC35GLG1_9BILA